MRVVGVSSMLGTFTIIVSVLVKKQVFSPKIHPIFMLSIADFILAVLWAVGGGIWFGGGSGGRALYNKKRDTCFVVLLATVVSLSPQCVFYPYFLHLKCRF